MTFTTKFSIGDRVRFCHTTGFGGVLHGGAFTVGQIRIQTLPSDNPRWPMTLIEYRAVYVGGRYGQWRAEKMLEPVR